MKALADETLNKHEESLLESKTLFRDLDTSSPSVDDLIDVTNTFSNSASYTSHTSANTTTTPSGAQSLLDSSVWDDVTKSGNSKSSNRYGVSNNLPQPIRHPNSRQSTNQITYQDMLPAAIQRIRAMSKSANTK